MLTSVSIVVVLAVIIATIARAVLADERHSAMGDADADTARRRADAGPGAGTDVEPGVEPGVTGRFPPPEWAATASGAVEVRVDDPPPRPRRVGPVPVEDSVAWWRRLRSGVLLALFVAVLGAATAAIIGVIVVVGVSVIDQALG